MKNTIHVQEITLENIPLLAAVSGKPEAALRDVFYKAKNKGVKAHMFMDDHKQFLKEWDKH